MNGTFDNVRQLLEHGMVQTIAKALAVVVVGWLLAKVINRKLQSGTLHSQTRLLLRRFLSGIILIISVTWALSVAGVDVGVLLGTAGILTVALGFAAQTSVSNLISGLFLMVEQSFKVGDIIEIAGLSGEVIAVDLLSLKLRTFNNVLVRIPNETMLKANVTNLTHFDIRRVDLKLSVAYKESLDNVRHLLLAVADSNPLSLKQPKPLIIFEGFGDSGIDVQFSVWAKKASYLDLKNSITEQVKRAFDEAGVEIPFPHRTLYAGLATQPLPVRIVQDRDSSER